MSEKDRRRHVRHEVVFPVRMAWGEGKTRDMSVSGAYIETPTFEIPVGGTFEFTVKVEHSEPNAWVLKCQGLVIRIEHHGDRIGVATSIDRYLEINPNMVGLEQSH